MILAKLKDIILLGLSDNNVKALTSGKVIKFKMKDVHPDFPDLQLCIVHGKTEDDITKKFIDQGLLNPGIIEDKRI